MTLGYFARKRKMMVIVYYATAGGVVEGEMAVSGSSGVGVSSTPWPLHKGQELRPVVSHWRVNQHLCKIMNGMGINSPGQCRFYGTCART